MKPLIQYNFLAFRIVLIVDGWEPTVFATGAKGADGAGIVGEARVAEMAQQFLRTRMAITTIIAAGNVRSH